MTTPLKDSLAANLVLRVPLHLGTIKDIGPNGTNLNFTGSPYWSNSPRGKALNSDGADCATKDISANINVVQGSVEGWAYSRWDASIAMNIFGMGNNDFSLIAQPGGNLRVFHDEAQRISTNASALGAKPGQWFHFVVTYLTGGNCVLYINGTQAASDAASGSNLTPGSFTICAGNAVGANPIHGKCSGDWTYWDIQLTPAQASQLYQESLQTVVLTRSPLSSPVPLPANIPDNLAGRWSGEWEDGQLLDLSGNENHATLASGRGSPILAKGPFGFALDGFDGGDIRTAIVSDAAIDNIWDGGGSVAFWVKARSSGQGGNGRPLSKGNRWYAVTQDSADSGFGDIQFGIDFDTTDGNWETTTNGFAFEEWTHIAITYNSDAVGNDPVIYVNGVSQAITENTTPVGARVSDVGSQLQFLGHGTGLGNDFDGLLGDVRLFSDILTAAEVLDIYEEAKDLLAYKSNDQGWNVSADNVTADFLENTEWQVDSGTWQVDDSAGAGKQITCLGAGRLYLPSEQAFGQWEFDLFKGADGNDATVSMIANDTTAIASASRLGYSVSFDSSEKVKLVESTGGATSDLFRTGAAYLLNSTWYRFKVERTASGQFSVYYRTMSGSYTLVDTLEAGSNPVTDTSVTSSSYMVLELGAGDLVRNIRVSPVIA